MRPGSIAARRTSNNINNINNNINNKQQQTTNNEQRNNESWRFRGRAVLSVCFAPAVRGLAFLLRTRLHARRFWKGRSIFSRATENGPAFRECFVCTNKHTAKCRPSSRLPPRSECTAQGGRWGSAYWAAPPHGCDQLERRWSAPAYSGAYSGCLSAPAVSIRRLSQ